jgi:hypothetical protein
VVYKGFSSLSSKINRTIARLRDTRVYGRGRPAVARPDFTHSDVKVCEVVGRKSPGETFLTVEALSLQFAELAHNSTDSLEKSPGWRGAVGEGGP